MDSMNTSYLKERNVNGVTILSVERGLKGTLESMLKDRIEGLVREGRLHIVIDLKQVPYLDSSDIGRIIRAHLSVRQAGGRVRLCHLSERVLAVLRISRLDTILDLYQTEADALAGIKQIMPEARAASTEDQA
jgi:anti-sigma B factor antagonist